MAATIQCVAKQMDIKNNIFQEIYSPTIDFSFFLKIADLWLIHNFLLKVDKNSLIEDSN